MWVWLYRNSMARLNDEYGNWKWNLVYGTLVSDYTATLNNKASVFYSKHENAPQNVVKI